MKSPAAVILFFLIFLKGFIFSQSGKYNIDSCKVVLNVIKDNSARISAAVILMDNEFKKGDSAEFIRYYHKINILGTDTLKYWFELSRARELYAYHLNTYFKRTAAAENLLLRVLHCYRSLGKTREIAKTAISLGIQLKKNLAYLRSAEYYYEALENFEKLNDQEGIGNVYNNLGNIYNKIRNLKMAVYCHSRSLQVRTLSKQEAVIPLSYYLIGMDYAGVDMNDSAQKYYRITMNFLEGRNRMKEELYAKCLSAYGLTLSDAKRYDEAIPYLQKALELRTKLKDKGEINTSKANIGITKLNILDFEGAYKMCKEAYDYSLQDDNKFVEEMACACLERYYIQKGDYKQAHFFLKRKNLLVDSLKNSKMAEEIVRKEAEYSYFKRRVSDSLKVQKEKDATDLQLNQQEKQLKTEAALRTTLFAGLGAVILLSIVIFSRYKLSKKQQRIIEAQKRAVEEKNQLIVKQKEEVEEKQRAIIDSINYAKKIQSSLMPSEKYLEKNLAPKK
jgi:tetratricopeptide (TPR) repeat protein